MLPHELETLAARHVPGVGMLDIQLLGAGLVNETYRVLRGGDAYAMRVAAHPCNLGVDREWEARVLKSAVAAQLAPPLVYCDPKRGILVSRWVEGRLWSPADVREAPNIQRMAVLLRRIHALPLPAQARVMSPAGWIGCYGQGAGHSASALRDRASAQLAALAVLPGVDPVMCHSDLHTLNLIDRGRSLILLDWEYAHASDPLWDLAAWSANNDLEPPLQQDLLAAYLSRPPTHHDGQRLQRLIWLYDYVCLLWSQLYLSPRGGAARDQAARDGVAARARLLAERLDAPEQPLSK